MVYLKLFLSFVKVGLFSFGGGYAMLPLIQSEVAARGWLHATELVDIIAIAEMTPGPIAVNAATYIGYRTAGFAGSIVATAGVSLPPIVLVLIIAGYFFKFRDQPVITMVFYGVRPAVTGLIIAAAVFIAEIALVREKPVTLQALQFKPAAFLNITEGLIMLAVFIALLKFKLHPLLLIALAGLAGIVIWGLP
ncbi:MAG: chromate transporter [Dethiobacteria bacterium]